VGGVHDIKIKLLIFKAPYGVAVAVFVCNRHGGAFMLQTFVTLGMFQPLASTLFSSLTELSLELFELFKHVSDFGAIHKHLGKNEEKQDEFIHTIHHILPRT